MTQPPPGQPVQVQINVPTEIEAGVFASFASIWQDNDGFLLDFATVTSAPSLEQGEDGGPPQVVLRAKVVSRVRIPPLQALELMRALNTQLGQWENAHGPVAGPPPEGA